MYLLRSTIAFTFIAIALYTDAQSVSERLRNSGNITLVQPAALDSLLVKQNVAGENITTGDYSRPASHTNVARSGYRVQVFDDNNPRTARRQAENMHSRIESSFPQWRSYVAFNSPYWQLKVGDFRSRAEAEAAMAELRHAFPSLAAYMRIVREKINSND